MQGTIHLAALRTPEKKLTYLAAETVELCLI